MDLFINNNLTNWYCNDTKERFEFNIEGCGYPCEGGNIDQDKLNYGPEYVKDCFKIVSKVWQKCDFSNNMMVIYEDKYNCANKGESDFVASCCAALESRVGLFTWVDEEETYIGKRYMWYTYQIDIERLFRSILLSDIGGGTKLDCAVYIIDNHSGNIFFLNDDRGLDVYSDDESYILNLQSYFAEPILTLDIE